MRVAAECDDARVLFCMWRDLAGALGSEPRNLEEFLMGSFAGAFIGLGTGIAIVGLAFSATASGHIPFVAGTGFGAALLATLIPW